MLSTYSFMVEIQSQYERLLMLWHANHCVSRVQFAGTCILLAFIVLMATGLVCLIKQTVNSLIWDSIVHVEVRADILMLIPGAIVSALSPLSLERFFKPDHACFPIPFRQVVASGYCNCQSL